MLEAAPRATFEVVEAELLFELLMREFARPPSLDRGREGAELRRCRVVGQVVFRFSRRAAFSDQPDLFAREVHTASGSYAIGDTNTYGGEVRCESSLGPAAP